MAEPHRLTGGTGLHKGDRDYQQDQIALWSHSKAPHCLLGVVADGMGGRSGGRKASDQVMMTARQLFDRFDPRTDSPVGLLNLMALEAHMVIRLIAVSAEQEPHSTMAAFIMMPNGECHWIHTGDSRIYLFRQGQLVTRTLDHSYVQTLVNRGVLTEDQARDHPQSNVLTGCLGMGSDAPPLEHHSEQQLYRGDAILACSDGLWHYFSDHELGHVLTHLAPRDACEALINQARERARGFGDNISVIAVKLD